MAHIRWERASVSALLLTVMSVPLYAQSPSVAIDGPAPGATVSGTVTVSGWAIDNVAAPGTAISSVVVQVDGTTVGAAAMGISRPDVCNAYPARPGCPNVGYVYSLNASALSPGTHSITVIATDTDAVPASGSASVQVTVGPGPSVFIDSPTSGAVVNGTINVSGWAIDNTTTVGTAISSVQVLVDGAPTGAATYGAARQDVCNAYPGRVNCPNVGYNFSLDTTPLGQGSHVITVTATDSDGNADTGSATTTINVMAPPAVMIDSITPGAAVSGMVNVSGWALDNIAGGTAISSVQILVDGVLAGNANYGVSRPDICGQYPGRTGCPNVGFMFLLDTKTLTTGTHTLTAVATDGDATPGTGSWTVNITVVVPPVVTIESPATAANIAGKVTVSGWALDALATGTAIQLVQVSVDGGPAGTAFYGLNRPDICINYPGRVGCPNVGFNYTLDATNLSAGTHTINVMATDSSNPPATSTSSVTVTVTPNHAFNLETPSSGSVVSGVVTVSGWAIAPPNTVMNSIKVYVDGTQVGLGSYGSYRPDACAAFPSANNWGCPYVGFSFNLNTASLSVGSHLITVNASTEDGAPLVGSGSVTVSVTR